MWTAARLSTSGLGIPQISFSSTLPPDPFPHLLLEEDESVEHDWMWVLDYSLSGRVVLKLRIATLSACSALSATTL
jgi:hypothetical protein